MTSDALSSPRSLRILHGLTGAAGQPWTISRAQRRLGVEADCVQLGDSKFGYQADRHLYLGDDVLSDLSRFLIEACSNYDVFHFYFRSIFRFDSRWLTFPTGLDLLALRAAGKAVIFHYRGSEARTASRFKELSPFNYVDENPFGLFDKFPEPTVEAFRNFVGGVANAVLVPDPELQSYVPGSSIVPRAVDLTEWSYVGVPDEEEPLIVHAPSRRGVKGTESVLAALSELRDEGLRFRFELVENLPQGEAREVYRRASIVVDQLRIGWYGVLAVEAMALGKATVAYVREDLLGHLPAKPPIRTADPTTIKAVLRDLISSKAQRVELGGRGRRFCEEIHDADRVARQLMDVYAEALNDPRPVSAEACVRFFLVQHQHTAALGGRLESADRGGAIGRVARRVVPPRVRRSMAMRRARRTGR